MPNKQAGTVVETFIRIVNSIFYDLKSFTANNDAEFADYEEVAKITDDSGYLAKLYWSSNRGLNGYINGLIKRFLSKGTNLNEVSHEYIPKIKYISSTHVVDLIFGIIRMIDEIMPITH
ncbi:hypothetical protein BTN49_1496 [Candidatus Enterovibrio escicola]|uniref:Mobile element protein n=1 Tax=Candidatus Enterovibrio escicola TaxID=1927127 RepID=A0A2A5T493_9GAMM|nr:hypothetical protein BTN49_1496 [Candidatus Enterovibrio escacola]